MKEKFTVEIELDLQELYDDMSNDGLDMHTLEKSDVEDALHDIDFSSELVRKFVDKNFSSISGSLEFIEEDQDEYEDVYEDDHYSEGTAEWCSDQIFDRDDDAWEGHRQWLQNKLDRD